MVLVRLSEDIESAGEQRATVDVEISYDIIKLFSEQLYASPVKAIEELVVNSWDAEATVCSTFVDIDADRPLIAVFDNGKGMTVEELKNLWHIGVSAKPKLASPRKQIGKFGIGKLASYAVARRVTYLSRTAEGLHAVALNFELFAEATTSTGGTVPVTLSIRELNKFSELTASSAFKAAAPVLAVDGEDVDLAEVETWTLVVLEDLREKAHELKIGRLKWVLETAMPLATDFRLYLNGGLVSSSKEKFHRKVEFAVGDLEDYRIADLSAVTGESWERTPTGGLSSPSFPSGVTGEVYVTHKSLYAEGGKSEDLGRSHGFFVRVHNRLINESDPLFGARPLSFTTWYRFAAIIEAPDLNPFITAARDDVEQSTVKERLRALLIQLFNQARDLSEEVDKKAAKANLEKKEGRRDYVPPDMVERPLADALTEAASASAADPPQDPPARGWRTLEAISDLGDLRQLVEHLYTADRAQKAYAFKYSPGGLLAPLARLDALTSTFHVNEDHELVREFSDKPESKRLLEALVVAETLLEVYLRIADVPLEVIDELLSRRDGLLRTLALDESHSLAALAGALRDASDRSHDLEIALVGALRALGFIARHIGGSGTPDGSAEYVIHGVKDRSFTLEAKSSDSVPSLGHLDFAGLRSHYEALHAQGCLLVAPSYPGLDDPSSQVSLRAEQQRVSCWTIDQLARVVESAEKRHINASKLQRIVLSAFKPLDVKDAVESLLSEPSYDKADLYRAVLSALASLAPRLKSTPRDVKLVAGEISRDPSFEDVDTPEVRDALLDLAHSSRGMLHVADNEDVHVLGALEELQRRVAHLTGDGPAPRRRGTFRRGADPSAS